jgi:hypothetical protein
MKKTALFLFVLLGFGSVTPQDASAGSAVAMEPRHGKLVSSYGHSKQVAMERALETARRLYGAQVRIIAATNVTGYCAIAVARHGDKAIVGVALGRRSATEADSLAIEQCLKAGGTNPRIISGWRG